MPIEECTLYKNISLYNIYFKLRKCTPKILRPKIESLIFTPPTTKQITSTNTFLSEIIAYQQIPSFH